MRGYLRHRGFGYLTAVVVTAAVLLVRRFALGDLLGPDARLYLFLFAVMAAAWYGGLGPGLLATALSGLAGTYFFIERDGWSVAHASDRVRIVTFLVAGVAVSWFTEAMYRGRVRATQQRESLRVTLQSIGDAVITTDAEGRVTSLNPVAVTLTGWAQDEAAGRPLEEVFRIVNERTRQTVGSPAQKVLAVGKVVGLANHTVLLARDGTERPIDDSAAPICDAEGRIRGVVLVFRDVTERRRSEMARAQLAAIVESSEDAIISKDLKGTIKSWNRGAERLYGYAAEEVVGRPLSILVPPDHPDELPGIMERLKRGERIDHFETVRVRKDGSRVDVSLMISPVKNGEGEITGASKIARDITTRRRAEEALRQSEERVRRLLLTEKQQSIRLQEVAQAARTLNASHSLDSVLRIITEEARRILGTHQSVSSLTVNGQWAQAVNTVSFTDKYAAWRAYDAKPDGTGIYRLVCRDNKPLRLTQAELAAHPAFLGFGKEVDKHPPLRGWLAVPFLGRDGRNLGLLQVSDKLDGGDFTEEDEAILVQLALIASVAIENARLYEELRQGDRRKDEFLATLAHELRNPLAPLRNGLHIMRLAGDDPAAVEQARAMMERQLQQLVRLIDDLLDVSRITRNKLILRKERADLATVLRNAVEISRPLIEAAGHELTVTLPNEPIPVDADVTRLAQVFSNLLNNAAKYTDRGGRVWLTVEREGSAAVVTVKDTGVGIPAEHLPHVFEMFAQVDRSLERSQGGLGLGLAVVRRLVELHGGKVAAHSEGPDKGSAFVVRLPVSDGGPAERQPPTAEGGSKAAGRQFKVLVVDDNADTAASLSTMLRIMGHDVCTAHDGAQAVDAAAAYRPDMVLLDIGLPKLNGYEAARRIREQPWGKDMKLIALTGWGQEEDRRRAKEAGFDEHVVKPVEPAALEQLLVTLCPGPP
jgi:PAS domain S-box-containing protein